MLFMRRGILVLLFWFDCKNQRVSLNRRKSSIITLQNIDNQEMYKCNVNKRGRWIFYKEVYVADALWDFPYFLSFTQLVCFMLIHKNEISTNLVDHFSDFSSILYDVIAIPLIVQLTQELYSLCGQRPFYEHRIFYYCFRCIFCSVDN